MGEVAGTYLDYQDQSHTHWFVRNAQGSVTTFAFPGTSVGMGGSVMINDLGQIAGSYQDSAGTHGFVTGSVFVEQFAGFSVTTTNIVPGAGAVDVLVDFTLCPGRTINPLAYPVIVKLTDGTAVGAEFAIPGGSFKQYGSEYNYQGVLHGLPLTVRIYPIKGSYHLEFHAGMVSGLPKTNPVTVTLIVGDNWGSAKVNAQ